MRLDNLDPSEQLRLNLVEQLLEAGVTKNLVDYAEELERYIMEGEKPGPGELAARIAKDSEALAKFTFVEHEA